MKTSSAKSPFDYRFQIVVKEWENTQSNMARLDMIAVSVRGWSISAFTALLAVAATQDLPVLSLYAIIPAILFWSIDALYRNFERQHRERRIEIEDYLASDQFLEDFRQDQDITIKSPNLLKKYTNRSFSARLRSVARSAVFMNVMITHVGIIFLSLLSFLFLQL